ncbi:MAG: DNA repair protein RecO [Thiotrichales bacterium]|nr:MAG: DNA repair protein RecO [Thiotrichales bacterium]
MHQVTRLQQVFRLAMQVNAEPAYILHKRPYRETSQILEVFSRHHGRLSLMSKGSRSSRSRTSGVLQPFRPLLLSWYGRSEMPGLRSVDVADARPPLLTGKALLSATYLNELLVLLLHKNDVNEALFATYHETLYNLQQPSGLEIILRNFEKQLLEQIGFGLNLVLDADSGEAVQADRYYAYHFEHGPVLCRTDQSGRHPVISGSSLLAFSAGELESSTSIAEIKKLMRYIINNHLGARKLKSRELFRSPLKNT